ncbi:MAG: Immunoglobulin I-set domain protein, partial [Bacillota bacterium]|nr:Immunoglobulin I-set domain protein [Bacillota bacterium]
MYNLLLLRNYPKVKKFLSMLLVLSLLIPLGISAPVYAGTGTSWTQVGENVHPETAVPDSASTILSISNGIPYVAYLEPAQSGGSAEARLGDDSTGESTGRKAVVKKLSGDTWETVDLGDDHEPDGFVTDATILKYDFEVYNGIPYFAYLSTDYDMMTLALMKYDEGNGWVTIWDEYSNANSDLAGATDLALDVSSGVPYIVWSTPTFITCLKYENGFQYFSEPITVTGAQSLSVQCDMSEGFIFVSCSTGTGSVEAYKNSKQNLTTDWSVVGESAVSANGTDPYLYVFENIPLITYAEKDSEDNASCVVKMLVNSHWVPLGKEMIRDFKVTNPSIYMDDEDTLYVAYQGPSSYAIVKKYHPQDQSWKPADGSNSYASTYIVSGLSLSAHDGIPYVSYIQAGDVMVMNYVPDEEPGGDTLELTAKAGNKQVKLTWDSFPGAGSYKVYKDDVAWSDVGGNSFTMRNLLNGTTYQFEVRALGDDFSVIGSSAKISATPLGVPEAPT